MKKVIILIIISLLFLSGCASPKVYETEPTQTTIEEPSIPNEENPLGPFINDILKSSFFFFNPKDFIRSDLNFVASEASFKIESTNAE